MKNLQFNPYQCGAGQDGLGLKMSKSIPALPHGTGLKSYPITFAGWGKSAWSEVGRGGSSKARQN